MIYCDSIEFKKEECCDCHMIFFVTQTFYQAMNDTGARFFCPAGHGQSYRETTLSVTQKSLESSQREAASLREEKMAAQRAQAKAERALSRHKKRAAAGVCPECNRTVSQLARHMEQKHSDFMQLNGVKPPKQLTTGNIQ
jgi:hypothetical protein